MHQRLVHVPPRAERPVVADERVRDWLDGVHNQREGHVEPGGETARREGLCGEERAQWLHHQRQPHEHLVQ